MEEILNGKGNQHSAILITNALIINEGTRFTGSLLIENERIKKIFHTARPDLPLPADTVIVDVDGDYLMPGVIDDQVHFREPGLTHKGDIFTESRAAVAGGVTSYIEMPNTFPPATTHSLLEEKYARAAEVSAANYSFLLGATNDNLDEILKTDPKTIGGIKLFMGSSTGNLLVDNQKTLEEIFRHAPALVAVHCEDEALIRANSEKARQLYGDRVPFSHHPVIRSAEACFRSSSKAVEMALRWGTRLHVFHLSTAREMELFQAGKTSEKKITAEVCIHHLWFSEEDYEQLGSRIKWNPAIKSPGDREELWHALITGKIDVVATDHAPHTIGEKQSPYFKAPSGGPMVQHSLPAMLEMTRTRNMTVEDVAAKMCHAPAEVFRIVDRGYIREGCFADLTVVKPDQKWTVSKENMLYKCGWSPLEGTTFSHRITHTFVNGQLVWHNNRITDGVRGKRLLFR